MRDGGTGRGGDLPAATLTPSEWLAHFAHWAVRGGGHHNGARYVLEETRGNKIREENYVHAMAAYGRTPPRKNKKRKHPESHQMRRPAESTATAASSGSAYERKTPKERKTQEVDHAPQYKRQFPCPHALRRADQQHPR